jgi:YesN/AraC family two-component response regulator
LNKLFSILICLLLSSSIYAQDDRVLDDIHQQKALLLKNKDDVNALKAIGFDYLHLADYDSAIHYGKQLMDVRYEKKDSVEDLTIYAYIILGQAYLMKGNNTAYNYLEEARKIGEAERKDSALCSVYNGLGLYAININGDYYRAMQYFFVGIETAKRIRDMQMHALLLTNVSGVCYLKRDTTGLRYGLEAYDLAHELQSPYLIYASSVNNAGLYYLKKDYAHALQYIEEAEFIMTHNHFLDQASTYAMYGLIVLEQGETKEAISYFQEALKARDTSQTSSVVYALYGYARALKRLNQPESAIPLLKEALTFSTDHKCPVHRDELLTELANCYEASGNFSQAMASQRLLQQEKDSLFNIEKEAALNELRVKYDIEKQENQIQKDKLELLQRMKEKQLLITIIVVILLVVFFLCHLYRKKSRLYKAIVQQNQEAVRREEQLKAQLSIKYTASSLSEEKGSTLFFRLEHLMEEGAYSDNLLTKEKIAEMLDTNRTYLSQIINEKTGKSFTQYVNRFRIDEAVRILNKPDNQTPLKKISADLGFNSMTTFYKLFRDAVGMTPNEYKAAVSRNSR